MDAQIASLDYASTVTPPPPVSRGARYVTKKPALKRALASLSQNLRTTLASFTLLIELMEADARAEALTAPGMTVAGARDAREAVSRQIRALLDDLRETGHPFAMRPAVADLTAIVERAASARQPMAAKRCLNLTIDAFAPLVVDGDARLLVRATGDLLDVVMRHAAHGSDVGCTIALDSEGAIIELACHRTRDAAQDLMAALHPFSSLDRRLDQLEPWLARHIIEHHGGRVSAIDDRATERCGFRIALPARLA